jgi:acetyl esterase/lipase
MARARSGGLKVLKSTIRALVLGAAALAAIAPAPAQAASFKVTVVPPLHGKLDLAPPLPPDGTYPAGTVVTLRATPDRGYVLDSTWYSVPGVFGQMYHESLAGDFAVTIDQDKRVGASFVEEAAVRHLDVTHDVVYARPGRKPLKYDVFSPKGARDLPVIVIIHGGGWVANDENIMRGLARELTRGGGFVVFSIDYRWAGKGDGDAIGTTMANIIEDVFGGIAHVMEHAKRYGGDPTRIGVTGDSAGGHLSAAASLMPGMIGSRGFGKTPGVFEFMPSYLPKGKSVEQVRSEMLAALKAAAPSYGVFRAARLNPYSDDPAADDSWKQAVAPLSHIPAAQERPVPQFQVRGTRDPLIRNEEAQEFLDALVAAGQRAEYVQVGGAGHAFFDWKPDEATKATFARYGVYYAAAMKAFFESVLKEPR